MKKKTHVLNKKRVTALTLTLIVCSLVAILSAGSVEAEDGPILSQEPRQIFFPSFFKNNGSFSTTADNSGQPYIGVYMTNDSVSANPGRVPGGAAAVSVTVSFNGTDKSIIQDGNALGAGIAAQGPSSNGEPWPLGEKYIDYGYTLLLAVDNLYDWPFIQGVVWEITEWGPNNLWPLEEPESHILDFFAWEYPQVLTIDSEVTLTMEWNSSLLFYYATIENVEYLLHIHTPKDIQHDYFMLGTVEREHSILKPVLGLPSTVKWLQFPGAWSNTHIGQAGCHSYLSSPSYKIKGESSWNNVIFAYLVNGTDSWLNNIVKWGGACHEYINVDFTPQHIHFYSISNDTMLESDNQYSTPNGATFESGNQDSTSDSAMLEPNNHFGPLWDPTALQTLLLCLMILIPDIQRCALLLYEYNRP